MRFDEAFDRVCSWSRGFPDMTEMNYVDDTILEADVRSIADLLNKSLSTFLKSTN